MRRRAACVGVGTGGGVNSLGFGAGGFAAGGLAADGLSAGGLAAAGTTDNRGGACPSGFGRARGELTWTILSAVSFGTITVTDSRVTWSPLTTFS